MGRKSSWVLAVPFLCFALASWLFISNAIDLRIQFDRAREEWRQERYPEAIRGFQSILAKNSGGEYAREALWEIATIYYYNVYDVSNALFYFERLISEFPETDRALDSRLKLAEIYEIELNEPPKALEHLTAILEGEKAQPRRMEAKFRWADVQFKLNQFDLAMKAFQEIIDESEDRHMIEKGRIRVGTILQVKKEYRRAVETFERILGGDACKSCRLQAQLALIESYELMDRIAEAVETAEALDSQLYPEEMKERLLTRLREKQRHYEPTIWAGR